MWGERKQEKKWKVKIRSKHKIACWETNNEWKEHTNAIANNDNFKCELRDKINHQEKESCTTCEMKKMIKKIRSQKHEWILKSKLKKYEHEMKKKEQAAALQFFEHSGKDFKTN